jgi:uncharacterized protein Veg
MVKKETLIKEFQLKEQGSRGWMSSQKLNCPYCGAKGESGKFSVIFNDTGTSSYHCFRASCPRPSGSLHQLLRDLERQDLIESSPEYAKPLPRPFSAPLVNTLIGAPPELAPLQLPHGLLEVEPGSSAYLNRRGWQPHHYEQFQVSVMRGGSYAGYLLFMLKEYGAVVGFLGRSVHSKEWHRENELKSKLGEEKYVMRYKNSKDTDFKSIVGAIDEVPAGVELVTVVEGIMDYVSMSRLMGDNARCVFTNGAKMSEIQARKIAAKSPKAVTVMYDNGAQEQAKKAAILLSNYVRDVNVIELLTDKDPGDFEEVDYAEAAQRAAPVGNSALKSLRTVIL